VLHHRVEPEEVRLAAVSEYEEIVGDGSAAGIEAALRQVDAGHLDHAKIEILLAPENGANRLGDLLGLEAGGRDLIQQRLKQMVVVAIEKNDLNGRAAERARDSQAAEARADNDDYPVSFRHNAASGSK